MLLTGLGVATLAWGGQLAELLLAGALYGIGFGTAQPALMAWTVGLVPAAERGKAIGTFYTVFELGIGAGAVGFGLVLGRAGFPLMFLATATLALAVGGLAIARFTRGSDANLQVG